MILGLEYTAGNSRPYHKLQQDIPVSYTQGPLRPGLTSMAQRISSGLKRPTITHTTQEDTMTQTSATQERNEQLY